MSPELLAARSHAGSEAADRLLKQIAQLGALQSLGQAMTQVAIAAMGFRLGRTYER